MECINIFDTGDFEQNYGVPWTYFSLLLLLHDMYDYIWQFQNEIGPVSCVRWLKHYGKTRPFTNPMSQEEIFVLDECTQVKTDFRS